jgi:hypothetical protein
LNQLHSALRSATRGLGRHTLSDQRIAVLNGVAPGWDVERNDNAWEDVFSRTVAFFEKFARLPRRPAKSGQADEAQLANWIIAHRQLMAGRGNLLAENFGGVRQARMEAGLPGWNADRPQRFDWAATYRELHEFVKVNDHWPNAHSVDESERALGKWVYRQQTASAGGRGSAAFREDKRSRLESIDPLWAELGRRR